MCRWPALLLAVVSLALLLAAPVAAAPKPGSNIAIDFELTANHGLKANHAAGTASARPPHPFTGSATFKRRQHGRVLWRSTIRVPLLGVDPILLGGRGFKATLARNLPGD
jgi:hypothetical protein